MEHKSLLVNVVEWLDRTPFLEVDRFNFLEAYKTAVEHMLQKDRDAIAPPEHIPTEILQAFSEGATCLSVGCFNAAATMFRLAIDLATRPILPEGDANGLNARVRYHIRIAAIRELGDIAQGRTIDEKGGGPYPWVH